MTVPAPLIPVTGSPAAVVEVAHALRDLGTRIGAIEARLHDLRTMAVWESPSGERFDASLRALPDVLVVVQARCRAAAEALLGWSVDLTVAIQDSTRAAERHGQARAELDAIERDLQAARLDPTSAWHEHLRTRQVLALQHAADAEELCQRAWLRLHDAAADCEQRLRAAARDSVIDSRTYAVLRDSRNVAEGVSALAGIASLAPGPQQAVFASAAAAGTGTMIGIDLLLLVGYGDGSPWDIALNTGIALSGRASRTLSQAAGVGAVKAGSVWRGEQRRTLDRIRQGHRELSSQLPPGLVRHDVREKAYGVNERWQVATAGGANAVRLETASRALHTVGTVGTNAQRAEYVTRPASPRSREEREAWERVHGPR